ncbi:DUF4393 domain-containing protein [Sulfitobacter sp. EhC04]|uniref:DUF4393 domain-containing protein n=1 Tax=Sulfitobacter sp. EhC04 TaxID=1849168 RepID=UPI0009EDB9A6|nr:DUF4393 domain-containing protein [Sulfitobacter sp. EhC04]
MSEEENKSDLINSAANLAKAIPIYDDALQPVMKETGKVLSTAGRAVNVAIAPIRGLVWGAERIEEWIATNVAKKLDNVPPDEIVTPDLAIAGPTIEALKFNGHKPELSEMFANLLASSMTKVTHRNAHPSYVGIISAMSSLDAQIFSAVSSRHALPTIRVIRVTEGVAGSVTVVTHFHPDLAKITLGYLGVHQGILEATQASTERLERLGLIRAVSDGYLTSERNKKEYLELETDKYIKAFKRLDVDGLSSHEAQKSYLIITQIGKNFRDIVLR